MVPVNPGHIYEGCIIYLPAVQGTEHNGEKLECQLLSCPNLYPKCVLDQGAYNHLVVVVEVEKDSSGRNEKISFLTMTASPANDDAYTPFGYLHYPTEKELEKAREYSSAKSPRDISVFVQRSQYWLEEEIQLDKATNICRVHMFRLPIERFFPVTSKSSFTRNTCGYYYRLDEESFRRLRARIGLPVTHAWRYTTSPPRFVAGTSIRLQHRRSSASLSGGIEASRGPGAQRKRSSTVGSKVAASNIQKLSREQAESRASTITDTEPPLVRPMTSGNGGPRTGRKRWMPLDLFSTARPRPNINHSVQNQQTEQPLEYRSEQHSWKLQPPPPKNDKRCGH